MTRTQRGPGNLLIETKDFLVYSWRDKHGNLVGYDVFGNDRNTTFIEFNYTGRRRIAEVKIMAAITLKRLSKMFKMESISERS